MLTLWTRAPRPAIRPLAEAQERLGASIRVGASMDRTSANLTTVTANLARR